MLQMEGNLADLLAGLAQLAVGDEEDVGVGPLSLCHAVQAALHWRVEVRAPIEHLPRGTDRWRITRDTSVAEQL